MASLKDSLIAQYKFNENTAGDNAELVTNGNFANWTDDNPDGWTVSGESGDDPEISEAATGEAHVNTPTLGGGMCNIYGSGAAAVSIYRSVTLVIGRKYRLSILVDTKTAGGLTFTLYDSGWGAVVQGWPATTGIKTFFFVATDTNNFVSVAKWPEATDITIDNISIKLLAVEDSSGNDHDGLAQQDTSAISVAGKINTAFDFNGSSDFIEIADHDDFTPALTPFSISKWVYMHDATNFKIASKGIYNTDGEWQLFTDASDKLIFRLYDESVVNCYLGRKYNTTLTSYENSWVHLVATYDGAAASSGIKLYLNAVRIDDTDDNLATFVAVENLTAPIYIGRYDSVYANGLIDNVMFFNKDLNLNEVRVLYNSGRGTENIPIGIQLSRTGHSFSSRQEI